MSGGSEAPRWTRIVRVHVHGEVGEAVAGWLGDRLRCGTAVVGHTDRRRVEVEAYPAPGQRTPAAAVLEKELATGLRRWFGRHYGVRIESVRIRRSAWEDRWKEDLEPVRVGRSIVIRPAWWTGPAPDAPIMLDIESGPAFGTGHHASTWLCLSEIDRLVRDRISGSLLDVGTGTGILAIAAIRLGFAPVLGIDLDPLAVREAQRNAARNGVDSSIFAEIDASRWRARRLHDVVVCNMISSRMTAAAALLRRATRPGGVLVVSGLLRSDWERTLATVAPGWRVERTRYRGAWVGARVRRPDRRLV